MLILKKYTIFDLIWNIKLHTLQTFAIAITNWIGTIIHNFNCTTLCCPWPLSKTCNVCVIWLYWKKIKSFKVNEDIVTQISLTIQCKIHNNFWVFYYHKGLVKCLMQCLTICQSAANSPQCYIYLIHWPHHKLDLLWTSFINFKMSCW